MSQFEVKLHRTWVQLLIENDFRDIAAIAIDSGLEILEDSMSGQITVAVDVPSAMFRMVEDNEYIRKVIERGISRICDGHLIDRDGYPVNPTVIYRVKLLEVEDDWQNILRSLIVNEKDANQAVITEKCFFKKQKQPYTYNEMKFASQPEIRIAQELESRKILFFPLPLAVRADTGNFYNDHREIDFLICDEGAWGILEVSYHPDRYEKDSEKDIWFKKSGILCIQHYTAERCDNNPGDVTMEFLGILAKYRKK